MSAYAALISLMRVIHDLEHHPSPPISLDKQLLNSITQRITIFQEFLESYKSPPRPAAYDEEEEVADPLEMRIAGAVHAAEDAIETHIVDSIKQERNEMANDEKVKSMNRCYGILQSVIEKMDSIKEAMIYKAPMVHDQVAMIRNVPTISIVARSETLVGSDAILLELMEKLVGGRKDCHVIPIVGMGGIGKTFLAKTIYADPRIKDRFVICAWATISQHYDTREILCELICQATKRNKEKLSGKSVDQLGSDLYKYLFSRSGKSVDELGQELHKYLFSRRFLIVMDDMWSIDSWDKIQHYFPNNCNGSRVLVTTRLSQLSSQLNNSDNGLCMSFLDKASSWDLFSKTVFGDEGRCPPELEDIGEKIVETCSGLPLSITVVGGLLKSMDGTRASWESIQDNFTSAVNTNNDNHCLRLLKLSYDHLPVYLKPCFLYMGLFEEDEEIRVSTLIQLWVSEGFLKPTNNEALETTARAFLQDLIDRNLILIDELGSTGSLRSCKIHDLVRDMCVKEGQKEGFYHVLGQCNPPQQGMNTQRRVVISEDTSKKKVFGDLKFMSRTRSIICDHGEVPSCQNLVLLRTLHSHTKSSLSDDENYLKSLVLHYVNLRHLAIKATRMSSFLSSVASLWNLHTLSVSYSFLYKSSLLADIWKMPQFRHIEFVTHYARLPDPPSCDSDAVVIMENLHTLKGIRNFKCSEGVVRRIPNIKRLKLEYNSYEYDVIDDDSSDDDNVVDQGGESSSGDMYFLRHMKYLLRLEVLSINFISVGTITPTQVISFPHSLKKLTLSMRYELAWDSMLEKFGCLPFLEKLKLQWGCFRNGEWIITEGQFPSLKYMELNECRGLKHWRAWEEDSAILPCLEHIKLQGLKVMKIPFELENIDTLRTIKLIACREGTVNSVKELLDEQVNSFGVEQSFYVVVYVLESQKHLLRLAAPNFYVSSLLESAK